MRILLPALFALVSTSALAAPAANWTLDKPQSKLSFTAAMNGQGFSGTFRRFDAHIAFDPNNLAGSSVDATIDMGSAATGEATKDQALPTDDWFAVHAFPQAHFRANQFKALGNGRFVANGMLTIRNQSRPASLPFQLAFAGDTARMQGSLTIDRRWFGVGQGQFAGTDSVAANVRIDVAISAHR